MYYNIFFKLNRINVLNTLYISTFLQIIIFRVHHSNISNKFERTHS